MNILLKNCIILTQNENRDVVYGDMLIEDGIIKEISDNINLTGYKIMDLNNSIVTPGFLNSHIHFGETIFRNHVKGMNLKQYIEFTEKFSNKLRDGEKRKNIVDMTLLEALKNGTTSVYGARGWKECQKFGIRGCLGYPLMKSEKLIKYYDNVVNDFDAIYQKYSSDRIKVNFWMHSLEKVEENVLEYLSLKMKENKELSLTVHIGETKIEKDSVFKQYGKAPIEILEDFNFLNKNTNLVHCTHLYEDELKKIFKYNTNVSLCPVSNFILNNDILDIDKFIKSKINISIATDGLATSNSSNLLDNIRFSKRNCSNNIKNQDFFDMITRNPSKTFGYDELGSLIKGNYADILIFDNEIPMSTDIIENLLTLNTPRYVMLGGEVLVKDYKTVFVDENKIIRNYQKVDDFIWKK